MPTTILSIDDDPAITELLVKLLRLYGFEVLVAYSGEEGLNVIRDQSPQAVILDLMMPGMNGWQVLEKLRSFSAVPVVALSALDDPSVIARTLNSGADEYLVKPVAADVLVAYLNKLIARAKR